MAIFSDSDKEKLLSSPGHFFYRAYGTSDPWTKFVFANGTSYAPSIESTEIAFDDAGTVDEFVSNETAEISISSGRVLDMDAIQVISGGLYTKSTVAGILIPAASQSVASGKWEYDKIIMLENQNGDGSEIAITSITASVDGLLVEGTDYFKTKLSEVGWGFYLIDSTTLTTELQNLAVVYAYTPSSSVTLQRGGIKVITPIEVAFQTLDVNGDYFQWFFYKCFSNGQTGHGFGSENSSEPITMDIVLTAKKDTNRTAGDQLYKIVTGPNLTPLG